MDKKNDFELLQAKYNKLHNNYKAQEKAIERTKQKVEELEKEIEKLNKEKDEWLEIENHADLYSDYKQSKNYKLLFERYKDLYDNQYKNNQKQLEAFQKEREIKSFQNRLEEIVVTKLNVKNERGAGRKPKYNKERVEKIIIANKEKSLRDIQKLLLENNEKVSIMTIRKYKST